MPIRKRSTTTQKRAKGERRATQVLFWRNGIQKFLGVLAWHGPLPRVTVEKLGGQRWNSTFRRLQKAGIVVRWRSKSTRHVYLALNPSHPAFKEIRALLRCLEPETPLPEACLRPPTTELAMIPKGDAQAYDLDMIFGWQNRGRFFLTLMLLGGRCKRDDLFDALVDVYPQVVQRNLRVFCKRGFVIEYATSGTRYVALNPDFPHIRRFRNLLKRLLESSPSYAARLKILAKAAKVEPYVPYNRRLPWLRGVKGARRPVGFVPAAGGAPLLFGTDSRYRALATLAVVGPMRAMKWASLSRMTGYRSINGLIRSGLIHVEGKVPYRVVGLNTAFPAYQELRKLLIALSKRYPPFDAKLLSHDADETLAAPDRWEGDIESLCIKPLRTKVLLSVAAAKGIDQSSLARLLPEHDRLDIRQALHMLEAMGVFRRFTEGTAKMFTLNEEFFAYPELRTFLRKLLRLWPRHKARVDLEERYMPPLRLRMRRDAE